MSEMLLFQSNKLFITKNSDIAKFKFDSKSYIIQLIKLIEVCHIQI